MKTFENIKTFKTFIQKIDEDLEIPKKSKVKRTRKEKIVTIPDWGIY
jgi:hypothetical protein